MTAIILAAGQGRRLWPLTSHLPKCLIPVGGTPLLGLMLERIARVSVKDVLIVAGFEGDRVQWRLRRLCPRDLRVRVVVNERFAETNNLFSLWLALAAIDGPVTILNGDDFFNVHILEGLLASHGNASAVVDFTRPLPPDAMKVVVRGRRVTRLGKTLCAEVASGNAIGMYRFSWRGFTVLGDELERWVRDGRVNDFYVAAIDALAARIPIRPVSTRGLTWGEIDDHEDLAAAPAKLARIVAEERGLARAATPAPIPDTADVA